MKLDEQTVAKARGWPGTTAELLNDVVRVLRRYVVMSEAQAVAVALFVVHTYAIEAADATAYLSVSSAEKRSGKTRLLEVLALLVARPLRAAGATEAALFRAIGAELPPTVLMDEVDAIFGPKARDHEDLRALLNAGYRRGTPVLRCVGEGTKQRVEHFPVFSAKVLAGIGGLPDTIADRALPIRLKRRTRNEQVERFRERHAQQVIAPLRDRLARFAEQHVDALSFAEPALPDELDDRAQDAVEPLLAIAELAGGEWVERASRALVELRSGSEEHDGDDSFGVRLLADVHAVFQREGADRISSRRLVDELREDEEAPWADWRGKGLTQRALAVLLGSYGISSRSVRLADGTIPKGYLREHFEDVWNRYLPESGIPNATTATTAQPSRLQSLSEAPHDLHVADRKTPANPHGCVDVADVAFQNGNPGTEGVQDTVQALFNGRAGA